MRSDPLAHDAWMDAFFASYYAHRPVNATFIGVHEFDDRLPDFSDAAVGDVLSEAEDLVRRAPRSDAGDTAVRDDPRLARHAPGPKHAQSGAHGAREAVETRGARAAEIDRRLALGFLEIQAWELTGGHFRRGNPSLYTGEAVFGVLGLFLTDYAPIGRRVEAAVARLEAVPAFLDRARENVRRAPAAWTARALRECDGALALLTDGFAEAVAGGAAGKGDLARAARRAARAFSEHRVCLESDLLGRATEDHACGPEALDTVIRRGHFLAENPDEIARYAEHELAEAEARLQSASRALGAATPAEALAGLADARPDAAGYVARFEEVWTEMRARAEQARLVTWPEHPIRYVPRPRWVRGAAPHLYFLFYRSPAAFGMPPVHDYLVAPLPDDEEEREVFLRANNDAVVKLNHVIHHGGLGHHVQNAYARRAPSRIGRVAAVDCASRIAMLCGGTMAEGWACYATDLAGEAGMLTPLERLSEVHGRVRMAVRALVDVRLHLGVWTLDEAVACYQARAGMSAGAAHAEAVKNSMFPGAALMYLTGTDAIHRLRAETARRAGAGFDLRRFHDEMLSWGSIPVSLIADEMTRRTDDT